MKEVIIKKIKKTDSVRNISISDLARIGLRTSSKICDVKKGELIKIILKDKEYIGIIFELLDDKMCILMHNGTKQWWSRYVKCQILSYNT
jgi:hypothetical protein